MHGEDRIPLEFLDALEHEAFELTLRESQPYVCPDLRGWVSNALPKVDNAIGPRRSAALLSRWRIFSAAMTLLAGGLLALPAVAQSSNPPRIHPPKVELLHGVVIGARTVPAYPAALEASTDQMGELHCDQFATMKVTTSTIFRVETASRYFDLSKLCTNDMAFDYSVPENVRYTWSHWQQLRLREPVVFRIVKHRAQLSISRCQNLGLLTKAQVRRALGLLVREGQALGEQRIYRSHCTYSVTEAYVKVTSSARPWTFRIVDSGPRSAAKNTQIGIGYSASLPPAW